MKDLYHYFLYRIKELFVWLGIPCLGAAAGENFFLGSRAMFFGVSMVFAMAHVLLINDWGDLKKNPLEKERLPNVTNFVSLRSRLLIFAVLSFTASFILYANLVPLELLVFFAIAGVVLSLLYSHPKTHFKESTVGASLLHFFGGLLQFMLGYMVFSRNWPKGILLGTFFSLIFVAGHLVHESIDIEEDKNGGIKTRATRFGVKPTLQAALTVFVAAHFYLLFITVAQVVNWQMDVIFLLPLVFHFIFLNRLHLKLLTQRKEIKGYQILYRLAYGISSVLFVLLSIGGFS